MWSINGKIFINNLRELYSINKVEEIYETPINSEIVHNLYNSIGSKLGLIENKEYVELKPENNILKIPELEYYESEGKTITNIIADKNIPLENRKFIIKTLENTLKQECGIKLQLPDGTILNPEDYNLSANDVEEDTIIKDKYGVKLDSKFTLNVVDAKILFAKLAETKDNIICSETDSKTGSLNAHSGKFVLNRNILLDSNEDVTNTL
ncbi:hypothetical protein H8356DRAFT_1286662 [Neocallimastix lanati (nom. inval.)]|uniref:Uncharacterized protein n=1 Tax=Neocallimastix californiae TaxID=1754190 RepID=A0A1Y2CGV2_9FUNG|nr:hypothetical protein H8356DRAFT_1286662 [Neocallimastix sp. JGI-2020a]ORY46259.1 hypothetical protein LY90DRAFT_509270 [Neocallimastix californiae]|eukprot:ORY46259.1 hypothetical protein LY90DRAFT_509270 [Neocallimastix californiae]